MMNRYLMRRHKRRVFIRQFIGGLSLLIVYGFAVYYFGG